MSTTGATLTVAGPYAPHAPVTIRRDAHGVAHVGAENEDDAWFGQGFAAAQDRLWQMEYDRRRATGRWAEVAGVSAVAGDRLARRMQLARSAKADVAAMSPETRAMFEAYAAGVNAFIATGGRLPPEYALTGIQPELWEAWHSCAAFKVRHVLMGVWQQKLAQAQLLAMAGAQAYAQLDGRAPVGSPVILPPDGAYARSIQDGFEDLKQACEQLGFLAAAEGGSNSWAIHGARTTTGLPVLCNDSHRALDVPSVYWQVHVTCPDFDATGATFPGLPGFPHFGHNGSVAWNITHISADYQDLYLEQFDAAQPPQYRVPAGWADAEHAVERIEVAGSGPVEVDLWRTRHGPVVHGDPRSGVAIALRYTATEEPNRGWECLRPMLRAGSVPELHQAMRQWVDPVNNLVSADTQGNIGYLTRGFLPVRSSRAHRQFPAPGWTGEHEWTGRVPFERQPQAINPPEGFIATANQAVTSEDPDLYIPHDFSPPHRAERIRELIQTATALLSPDEIAAWQADMVSLPARAWAGLLKKVGPFEGDVENARAMLAQFDGDLRPDSASALLYGFFRQAVGRALFEPVVGRRAWEWIAASDVGAVHNIVNRWLANVVCSLEAAHGDGVTVSGKTWNDVLPDVLAAAWPAAITAAGANPAAWSWGDHHQTAAAHPLSARVPGHAGGWDPPRVPMGGDVDTLQRGGYFWRGASRIDVTDLSVYRQVVDLSDVAGASSVIPGGVSGDPTSPHYQDQLPIWAVHRRIPMHFTPDDVGHATVATLTLAPA